MRVLYEFRCDAGHVSSEMWLLGEAPSVTACIYCEPFERTYSEPRDDGTVMMQAKYPAARRLPSRGAYTTFPGSHNAEYRRG